jgi:hypothetical protein
MTASACFADFVGRTFYQGIQIYISKLAYEPVLHLFPRPGSLAQKREAGFYGRIELKTADRNPTPHFAPAMPLNKLVEYGLQGDAVQWITGMGTGRLGLIVHNS